MPWHRPDPHIHGPIPSGPRPGRPGGLRTFPGPVLRILAAAFLAGTGMSLAWLF
jgi:hypothetical protein